MENHPILSKVNSLKIALILLPVVGFFDFIANYFITFFIDNSQFSIFVVVMIRNILFSLLYLGNYIFIVMAISGIQKVKDISTVPNTAKGFKILAGLQFFQVIIAILYNFPIPGEFFNILSLLLMCIFVGIQCFAFVSLGKFIQRHLITNPQDRMGIYGVILISVHYVFNFLANLIFQIFYIFIYLPSLAWATYTFDSNIDSNFDILFLLSNMTAVVKIVMSLVNVAGFILVIIQLSRHNIANISGGNGFKSEFDTSQTQINQQPQFSSNMSVEQQKFCMECGAPLHISATFCQNCGKTVN